MSSRLRVLHMLGAFVLIGCLSACDDEPEPNEVVSIQVDPSTDSITMEETAQFTATATYEDGYTDDVTTDVTWSTSDSAVASISASGLATPAGDGTTTVTATLDSLSDDASLTVEDLVLESCQVEPIDAQILVGGTEQYDVMGTYTNGTSADISASADWASSDTGVASVDSSGMVTGAAGGTAEIQATVDSMQCDAAEIEVIPGGCETLTVTGDSTTIPEGSTLQLTATCVIGSDTVDVTDDVDWTSSADTVATVAANGEVTGVAAGTATITATYTNSDETTTTGTYDVEVIAPLLESISITPATPVTLTSTLPTQQYTATCIYGGGVSIDCTNDAALVWASSDEAIATISNADTTKGLVTAVANGTTSITATMNAVVSNIAVVIVDLDAFCESIEVTTTTPTIPIDATADFMATCIMDDGTPADVTATAAWDSSAPAVASIGADGVALGVSEGTTNITATVEGGAGPVLSPIVVLTVVDVMTESIAVEPNPLTVPVGGSDNLTATATLSDSSTLDVTAMAAWTSDDDTIATVNPTTGEVTGVASGTTMVNATYDGITGSAAVVVAGTSCETVNVSPDPADVAAGTTVRLTATCSMSDGTSLNVTSSAAWDSDDDTIAAVDNVAPNHGRVHGMAPGTTAVNATYRNADGSDVTGSATVNVTGGVLESISIEPALPDDLPVGNTEDFIAWGHYSDGATLDITDSVTWDSSDDAIATVSNAAGTEGRTTGEGAGTATITATDTDTGEVGSVVLDVTDAVIESINVTPADPTVAIGFTVGYTATATMSDGAIVDVTDSVTWSPGDDTIATISNAAGTEGVATGQAAGTTTITATDPATGVPGTADITVTSAILTGIVITPAGGAGSPYDTREGETTQFTAEGTFSDGSTQDITEDCTWDVINAAPSDGTVSNAPGTKGLFTAVTAGPDGATQVVATHSGLDDTVWINIDSATISDVQMTVDRGIAPVGFTVQGHCTVYYTEGDPVDVTDSSTYASTISTVASVDANGLVSAASVGNTNLSCNFLGVGSATVPFEVSNCTIESMTVVPAAQNVSEGASFQFAADGFYGATCGSWDVTTFATWTSLNETVATVSNAAGSEGLATAVGSPGEFADIEARIGTVAEVGTLTITDACIDSVYLVPAALDVAVGASYQMDAWAVMSTGPDEQIANDDLDLSWSRVGTDAFIVVSSTGLVTGLAEGDQDVAATMATSRTCGVDPEAGLAAVAVTDATLTSINIDEADLGLTIAIGATHQYNAWANYSDGSSYDITNEAIWNSTIPAFATISPATGIAQGVAEGLTTITVSYGGHVDNTSLNVSGHTQTGVVLTVIPDYTALANPADNYPTNVYLYFTCEATFDAGGNVDVTDSPDTTLWSEDDTDITFPGVVAGRALTVSFGNDITITCENNSFEATMDIDVRGRGTVGLTGVTVTPGSNSLYIGETDQYTATADFSNGQVHNVTDLATWTPGDPAFATVSNAHPNIGVVTAEAVTADVAIIANYSSDSDYGSLEVLGGCVDDLIVTPVDTDVAVGNTIDFTAMGQLTDGGEVDLTNLVSWEESSSGANATIDATGTATGIAAGDVTITATYIGGQLCTGIPEVVDNAALEVTDEELVDIVVTCPVEMVPGEFGNCTAMGEFTGGIFNDVTDIVTWEAAPGLVMTIDDITDKGAVEALADGTATVSASHAASGANDSVLIIVLDCTLDHIAVTPNGLSLPVGFTQTYTASGQWVTPGGAACARTNLDVTALSIWDSTDEAVATIDDNVATTVGVGHTRIRASYQGMRRGADLDVNDATLDTIVVNPDGVTIAEGQTLQFTAIGTFSDLSTRNVTVDCLWENTVAGVATVSNAAGSEGLATGENTGTTSILCTIDTADGPVSDSAVLNVSSACLERIRIAPRGQTYPPNVPVNFTVTGYYSDNSTAPLTDVVEWLRYASLTDAPDADGNAITAAANPADTRLRARYGVNTCSGSNVGNTTRVYIDDTAVLESLRVDPDPSTVSAGAAAPPIQLTAWGTFTGDDREFDLTRTVNWVTSDVLLATVSNAAGTEGQVDGVSPGEVIISAVDPATAIFYDAHVTVSGADLDYVIVTAEETRPGAGAADPELPEGGLQVQFHAYACYTDGVGCTAPYTNEITDSVSWSSEDDTMASVTGSGLVETGSVDSDTYVEIEADAGEGTPGTLEILVIDGSLTGMRVDDLGVDTIGLGTTTPWEAHVTIDGVRWYQVTRQAAWESDDDTIADVSSAAGEEGLVEGIAVGTTTIWARFQGRSGNDNITVNDITLDSVEVVPSAATVCLGGGYDYDLLGHFSDGSSQNLSAGTVWYRDALAGDPWENMYCGDINSDGYIRTYTNLPPSAGGGSCDGVVLQVEACYTIGGGGGTVCSYHAGSSDGNITIDGSLECGDTWADSILIPGEGSYPGSTVGWNNDMEPEDGACHPVYSSCGRGPDLWYELTLVAETDVSVNVCDADYDSTLYILASDHATTLHCNEDSVVCQGDPWFNLSSLRSYIDYVTLPAGTYYIVVDGYGTFSEGSYTLEVDFM